MVRHQRVRRLDPRRGALGRSDLGQPAGRRGSAYVVAPATARDHTRVRAPPGRRAGIAAGRLRYRCRVGDRGRLRAQVFKSPSDGKRPRSTRFRPTIEVTGWRRTTSPPSIGEGRQRVASPWPPPRGRSRRSAAIACSVVWELASASRRPDRLPAPVPPTITTRPTSWPAPSWEAWPGLTVPLLHRRRARSPSWSWPRARAASRYSAGSDQSSQARPGAAALLGPRPAARVPLIGVRSPIEVARAQRRIGSLGRIDPAWYTGVYVWLIAMARSRCIVVLMIACRSPTSAARSSRLPKFDELSCRGEGNA